MPNEIIVNFKLTPELKKRMDKLVASGRYASQSELLRESLRRFLDAEARMAEREAPVASVFFPSSTRQKFKTIEGWISELQGEWIRTTKESGEMIEEERDDER